MAKFRNSTIRKSTLTNAPSKISKNFMSLILGMHTKCNNSKSPGS
jgi:hypothetical protein